MMRGILVIAMLLCAIQAQADVIDCIRTCLGVTSAEIPTQPPTSPATLVFPDLITFDETSDQGPVVGTACVLFPASWAGKITAVAVNGEQAVQGNPHYGRPTFYAAKPGSQYTRPLKFVITATSGTYTATSSAEVGAPAGGRSESASPSSCANPPGPSCRQNMRFSKPGSLYGNNVEVWIDGVKKMTVADGSQRTLGPNGMIWKPISENDKRLVIIGEFGKRYQKATVRY